MSETTLRYGLHSGGFVRMRLPEIRRAIFDDLTRRTGWVFDETPDSVMGQLVGVFAEREAAMWELAEKAYLSAYPATATGLPLDLAVSYAGVRRLQPVRSRATAYFLGDPGTVIPEGTIVRASVASDAADIPPRFYVEVAVTLQKASVIEAGVSIPATVQAGQTFWVEVNGVRYSTTAGSGQSPQSVASALGAAIGSNAVVSERSITISRPTLFAVDWSIEVQGDYIASLGFLVSEEFGAIPAAERTLTEIVSPIGGFKSVYNPFAAIPGRLLETEAELRNRYQYGVFRLGAGTVPSIHANIIQDIPGLRSLVVYENNTMNADADGRPPKSIEVIAEGGDREAIINKLYKIKPAGITSFGNTSGQVRAEDGFMHTISFTRPELRWIWLRISVATNPEELIPGDLYGRIVSAILEVGANLLPGRDVIIPRLEAAPFNTTTGISRLTIVGNSTAPNSAAPNTYGAANITIGTRQKAVFDISRIRFD